MFKYKSPLSRLLEGGGKPKEAEPDAVEETKPEPIADFNALRQALAGNTLAPSDTSEEAEDLIPEAKMPPLVEDEVQADAPEAQPEDNSAPASDDDSVMVEVMAELNATPEVTPEPEAEPVVTLHVAEEIAEEELQIVEVLDVDEQEQPAPEETVVEETVVEVVTDEPVAQAPVPEPEVAAPAAEAPAAAAAITVPAPSDDRRGRVKTTFLGFERADTHVQDMIETAEPVAKAEATQETFPVGWLVVTAGPGRGTSITLTEGLMQIGRNDDQAIQLDFGDTGISRSNHAVIAYDPEDRKCYLGHGGKANLVRLNGKPVLSTVALNSGDLIRISETSVRFAAFCDDGFDWRDQ